MLIKVGSLYLTLGTFNYNAHTKEIYTTGHHFPIHDKSTWEELERILDEAIAAQQSIDAQVKQQIEKTAELNEQIKKIAAYEQELQQKEAQLIAAHQAVERQKSPMIIPPGFGRKRG